MVAMASGNGDPVDFCLEDYDLEIERLQKGKADLKKVLDDPEEKKNRHERRVVVIGRYATGLPWTLDDVKKIRESTEDEGWLFSDQLMKADGWDLQDGKWTLKS